MSKKGLLAQLRGDVHEPATFAQALVDAHRASPLPANIGSLVIGLESDSSQATRTIVDRSLQQVQSSISVAAQQAGITLDEISIESAILGMTLASTPRAFLEQRIALPKIGAETTHNGMSLTLPYNATNMERPKVSLESFDESATRTAAPLTAVYNQATAANQTGVDQLFFPSTLGDPSSPILSRKLTVPVIQQDITRNPDGNLTSFGYRSLLRSHRNHTMLSNDSTRVYPIVRASTTARLVPNAVVPHKTVKIDGVDSLTAPLLFGERYDLLGISQPDNMMARGLNDATDVLHAAASLDVIYLEVAPNKVVGINVRDMMSSAFVESASGRDRTMVLTFNATGVAINKYTLTQDGTALGTFAGLNLADGWMVRLDITASGSLNLATGDMEVYLNNIRVSSVTNPARELRAPETPEYIAAKAAVEDIVGIGYDQYTRRSNINRRQIGLLLEQITFSQVFPVPYGAPISIQRPTDEQSHETLTVNNLIYATKVLSIHNAVTRLFETRDRLRERQTNPNDGNTFDEILGIGALAVRPAYIEASLDMPTIVDSLSSSDRRDDIAATFENIIRNIGYQLYVKSEISSAADYYLGANRKPILKVATSPVIAQYLSGMTNTTHEDVTFEVKVGVDITDRMQDRIFITLHYDGADDNQYNPCQFGFRAIYPEVVAARNPTFRNGAQSNILTVTPHFEHFVTMHVLGYVEVQGLGQVLGKIGVNVNLTGDAPVDLLLGDLTPVTP